jgi:hypothetical protein|tara:strand:+ start:5201 stop:5860 length:660 start_codon:yes stop_codon:yes gene_type:complete
MKICHVIGNGDKAHYYNEKPRKGMKLLCNMPPFEIDTKEVYATCMVDFKMMMALTKGELALDQYEWILGTRPRIWMYERSQFYLKYAHKIKDFYTDVPKYAGNATNFNCGHMAVHYAAKKHKMDEINMYGFDTIFDFNMRSYTDLMLASDRSDSNNYRLLGNWRPVWVNLFKEFPNTQFVLHHNHDHMKIPKLDNVRVEVYKGKMTKLQERSDPSDMTK